MRFSLPLVMNHACPGSFASLAAIFYLLWLVVSWLPAQALAYFNAGASYQMATTRRILCSIVRLPSFQIQPTQQMASQTQVAERRRAKDGTLCFGNLDDGGNLPGEIEENQVKPSELPWGCAERIARYPKMHKDEEQDEDHAA